ncbi:hypothetical protein JCM6882_001755 [Rhodosporidiobolus microsporus]
MAPQLPNEVVQGIVLAYSSLANPREVAALALVSPTFRSLTQQHLLSHLELRSTTSVRQLLVNLERDTSIGEQARSLTVGRGTRQRLETTGRGKKKQDKSVEDAVTEEDLVKLCRALPNLAAVHLRETTFSSLRRRQLGCLSSLTHLATLSISGRATAPFNLSTIGQLLLTLPRLQHLSLRSLNSPSSSLSGFSFPTCNLVSFALFTSASLSDKQLFWLLRSSLNAESLGSLAFDISPTLPPWALYPVRWAPIRTTDIYCTSEQTGAVENLPRHCPSLQQYTFRTSSRMNAACLLESCDVFGTVTELSDASEFSAGLHPLHLASALLERDEGAPAAIRRIRLSRTKRDLHDIRLLRVVCKLRSIELGFFDVQSDGEEPYIPEEFAMLRRVKLE